MKNIWNKPDRVVMYHGNAQKDIDECDSLTKITKSCWYFDLNKV